MCVLDDRKRAVATRQIKLQSSGRFENSRRGDLRTAVFHPIWHVYKNTVLVACGDVPDRLGRGLHFRAKLDLRFALFQVEAEVNGNELGIEHFGNHTRQNLEPGISSL